MWISHSGRSGPPLMVLVVTASLLSATAAYAQIPSVPELCADRPLATGRPMFALDVPSASDGESLRPASDLFCIDLFGTNRVGDAAGMIRLARPWSPFGVSVTADGHHRYALTAWIARLPDPSTLGPYGAYVAWATPLELDPMRKIGEVSNGQNDLGQVDFNKFMILITAEASADVAERTGPLVLRGRSPSARMEAHDLLALAPSAETGTSMQMGRMDSGWRMPPMYEGVPMLPGIMDAQPRPSPLLPTTDAPLPAARQTAIIDLPNGGTLDLEAGFVRKQIGDQDLVMFAFNEQIPGPLIRVREQSTIFVNFTNGTPFPTAVHWHGIRLDNRFDGVPGVTQDPVEPGGSFRYQIHFPDAGIYWYHPHHREDVQQELGLAGNLLVDPLPTDYYSPVNREEVVLLDDILLDDEGVIPFGAESANYMLMGRFGNVFLTNGEPDYALEVNAGDVVRFYWTNASNTRTFNLSLRSTTDPDAPPLPLKVVASDVGRFERESLVESVVLAPAERYVTEVRFPTGGAWELVNQVQGINHRMGIFLEERRVLGTVAVSGITEEDHGHHFEVLRTNTDVIADIDAYRDRFDDPPNHELVLTLEVDSLPMAIEQSMAYDWAYFNPVEWTGTMPMMNWASSGAEINWLLRDPMTGNENDAIHWRFQVGDVVKIRVRNDRSAFHAMQHPLHIHGQRFLVLEQNGVPNENLVWKDTVLLPSGSTTDILLELSNPGRWMVHCHIAEHLESGMKFVFDVDGESR